MTADRHLRDDLLRSTALPAGDAAWAPGGAPAPAEAAPRRVLPLTDTDEGYRRVAPFWMVLAVMLGGAGLWYLLITAALRQFGVI